MIEDWANGNGLTLIQANMAWIWPVAFWFTSRNQTVYRITVRNPAGETRTGWARCGNWLVGLWSNEVDVQWDDADAHWKL